MPADSDGWQTCGDSAQGGVAQVGFRERCRTGKRADHPRPRLHLVDDREVVPSAVKPFEAVKEQARAAVGKEDQRCLAEKAKKLVERARAGSSLDDLAKDSSAEIKTAQGLKRNESGLTSRHRPLPPFLQCRKMDLPGRSARTASRHGSSIHRRDAAAPSTRGRRSQCHCG